MNEISLENLNESPDFNQNFNYCKQGYYIYAKYVYQQKGTCTVLNIDHKLNDSKQNRELTMI